MSQPGYCYRCQDIVTFCECETAITSEGDWQRWAQHEIERLSEIERLAKIALRADQSIARAGATYTLRQIFGDTND